MPFTKKRNVARIPSVYGSGSRNRNQSGWQSKAYNSVLGPYSFNFAGDNVCSIYIYCKLGPLNGVTFI